MVEACPYFGEAQGKKLHVVGARLHQIAAPQAPISPRPVGKAAAPQQSKLAVTNIYQHTQIKCQMVFLGHDPEKWGWVALIHLLLTATANLTPTSFDCHENLP